MFINKSSSRLFALGVVAVGLMALFGCALPNPLHIPQRGGRL